MPIHFGCKLATATISRAGLIHGTYPGVGTAAVGVNYPFSDSGMFIAFNLAIPFYKQTAIRTNDFGIAKLDASVGAGCS